MAPVAEETAIVPEPVEQEVVYWEGEPATCDELLDKYVIESKFAAMVPGELILVGFCQAYPSVWDAVLDRLQGIVATCRREIYDRHCLQKMANLHRNLRRPRMKEGWHHVHLAWRALCFMIHRASPTRKWHVTITQHGLLLQLVGDIPN